MYRKWLVPVLPTLILAFGSGTALQAQEASIIAPAPAARGVLFQPADAQAPRFVVQIAATSLEIDQADVPAVPDGLGAQEGVEEGVYMRQEWDKGAFLRDGFSARWTGTLSVEKEGEYTFYLTTDDGTRMKIDGETVIEDWVPRPPTTSEKKVNLSAGDHEVVVEFYEGGGGCVARLEWSAEGFERQVIPKERVSADGKPGWSVQYFTNVNLEGEGLADRVETIDFDWGNGGPQVGKEEPGRVAFDWTRISDTSIVGRINAGPATKMGIIATAIGGAAGDRTVEFTRHDADVLLAEVGGRKFGVKLIDPAEGYRALPGESPAFWCPPTEGSVMFLAGFIPVPQTSVAEGRRALREAFEATANPNLPPYEADGEGWITLFDGKSFDGWQFRGRGPGHWTADDGVLENTEHGGIDMFTEWTFLDHDLHIDFSVPQRSNSGVYFQGRYEVQVLDSHGTDLWGGMCGSIYQMHMPKENVAKPPGEWQTFDVQFTSPTIDDDGRHVPARMTVRWNEVLVIDDVEVPRETGGAINRNYLEPGPLMLQGNHGPVSFRNIKVRPK